MSLDIRLCSIPVFCVLYAYCFMMQLGNWTSQLSVLEANYNALSHRIDSWTSGHTLPCLFFLFIHLCTWSCNKYPIYTILLYWHVCHMAVVTDTRRKVRVAAFHGWNISPRIMFNFFIRSKKGIWCCIMQSTTYDASSSYQISVFKCSPGIHVTAATLCV